MIALLVATLTASSALAALWPLVRAEVPRLEFVMPADSALESRAHKRCRRITIIRIKPQQGTITKGCSSARKRPCVRRRNW